MINPHQSRLDRVLDHVRANLAGDLSLDALADVAAMSRFHWARAFTAMTGETPAEAVRRERLNAALRHLVEADQSVARIGRSVGYPNADSFTRAFRAAFGITPRAVRLGGKVPPPLSAPIQGAHRMHTVTTTREAAFDIAALPYRGAYHQIGAAFQEAYRRILATGAPQQFGPGIGIYYDTPGTLPEAEQRAHAGCLMLPGAPLPEGLERVSIPGGRVAVLRHKGPYSGIPAAWQYAYGTWLPTSGAEPADHAPYERYLNTMGQVAPEDLLTEIVIPLKE